MAVSMKSGIQDIQVSVVIPTYNRARMLREALESVFGQSHRNLQVIVVDDGSEDETSDVLDEFSDRVQSISLGRSGVGMARNRGIDAATGEYIAFLDSDDIWVPEKVEKQLAFASEHLEMAFVYTDATQFGKNGIEKKSFVEYFPALNDPDGLFAAMIAKFAIPLTSTVMAKTAFMKETGVRFTEGIAIGEDLGLFLQALAAGARFGYLPERLTMRRMHDSNISGNHCRRFEQRKFLYSDLLGQLPNRYTPRQRSALQLGLRDARYRVGECRWAELKLSEARKEFFRAMAADTSGIRAFAYWLLTFLPSSWIARLRG